MVLYNVCTAQSKVWRTMFDLIHRLSHPVINMSQKFMTSRFVWNWINKEVGNRDGTWLGCQQAKAHQHVWAQLQHGQLPNPHFKQLYVNIVGLRVLNSFSKSLFTLPDGCRPFQWLDPELFHVPPHFFFNMLPISECQEHLFWWRSTVHSGLVDRITS